VGHDAASYYYFSAGHAAMIPRILYLHGAGEIGGAERALLSVLERLNRELWVPLVACPDEGPFVSEVRSLGVPTYPMFFPAWRKLAHLYKRLPALRKLSNLLQEIQPAILHVNDMYWVPQAIWAAKQLRVPVVSTIRQNLHPIRVHQYQLNRAERLITVSEKARDILIEEGVPSDRVDIIPSGIDIDRLTAESNGTCVRKRLGIPLEAPVIGCLANVLEIKGQDILLYAFSDVAKFCPDVHLILVGRDTSSFGGQMHALAGQLGIGTRTHFVGFQADVRQYIAAMNLVVLPSRSEGLPVALLEAMAMGVPVVASAVGGVPELIVQGVTGRLVKPEDPSALGEAIRDYLTHPQPWIEEGKRGKERVQNNYSIQVEIQALEDLYHSVVSQKSRYGGASCFGEGQQK
jgi:glycosyltransferase involved in cell wall biosynthesis